MNDLVGGSDAEISPEKADGRVLRALAAEGVPVTAMDDARGAGEHLVRVFLDLLRVERVFKVVLLAVARADGAEAIAQLIEARGAQLPKHLNDARGLQALHLADARLPQPGRINDGKLPVTLGGNRLDVLGAHDGAHPGAPGGVLLAGHDGGHADLILARRADHGRDSPRPGPRPQRLPGFEYAHAPQILRRQGTDAPDV